MAMDMEAQKARFNAQPPFGLDQRITILSAENPKKRTAKLRFLYHSGMRVAEYIELCVKRGFKKAEYPTSVDLAMADLRWDHAAEFIRVE